MFKSANIKTHVCAHIQYIQPHTNREITKEINEKKKSFIFIAKTKQRHIEILHVTEWMYIS